MLTTIVNSGYGFGPMLWSPMSEIPSIGRRGIYFWTMLLYVLLQLPTGFAVNMPMFLVFRVITGFFGSPALATGGGTITDMYDASQSAYGICILGFFGVCGPVFGPIIGGFLAPVKGWRWTIWVSRRLGLPVIPQTESGLELLFADDRAQLLSIERRRDKPRLADMPRLYSPGRCMARKLRGCDTILRTPGNERIQYTLPSSQESSIHHRRHSLSKSVGS